MIDWQLILVNVVFFGSWLVNRITIKPSAPCPIIQISCKAMADDLFSIISKGSLIDHEQNKKTSIIIP